MQTEIMPVGNDIFNPVMYTRPKPAEPITKGQAPAYLMNKSRKGKQEADIQIPVFSIYPNRIVSYTEIERTWQRSLAGIQSDFDKPMNDTQGKISISAKKRIMNAVNWLYYLSKEKTTRKDNTYYRFRVNLITLTLPSKQVHSDKYIKAEMLNDFLEWMRYQGVKSYVWKAEPQKSGNIHFHITTNVFIHWEAIRDKWNKVCKKHGYLQAYTKRFAGLTLDEYIQQLAADGRHPNYEDAKRAWEKGTAEGWANPNSTDVHSVKKVRKLAAYIAKYLTKESDIRKIEGRQWFLSTNLSNIKAPVIVAESLAQDQFSAIQALKSSFIKYYDYAAVMFYDYRDALKHKCHAFIDELINLSFQVSPLIN